MATIFIEPLGTPFPGGVAGGYGVDVDTHRSQTALAVPLGTVARDALGNEFTLIKAGAAIAVNEAVVFNAGFADCRKSSGANQLCLGVATAAFSSGDYGWLLTRGVAVCKLVGGTAANALLVTTATGATLGLAGATDLVSRGAVCTIAESGGLGTVYFQ